MIRVNTSKFNLREAANRQRAALGLYADAAAKKMEASAKQNAKWTDRTSNARQSITGDAIWRGGNLVVRLHGSPDYFVYLELAYEKKYAILQPTIAKYTAEVLSGYQRLVKD